MIELFDVKDEQHIGDVLIKDETWLVFDYKRIEEVPEMALMVDMVDTFTQTTTRLGYMYNGYWHFPNAINASKFWNHVKQHRDIIKPIIDKINDKRL